MTTISNNLKLAIEASVEAGRAIMKVYDKPSVKTQLKDDRSPLTEADLASNEIIISFLEKTAYPIISEEKKNKDFSERKHWEYCWIVDPLDGTKEFIKRNGEFTVNVALCRQGVPMLGVIYVPVCRELYYGIVDEKIAYKTILDKDHKIGSGLCSKNDRIYPSETNKDQLLVVGSRSHMNQETLDFISEKEKKYDDIEIVSKGSSLKFCLVAEGKANIYPRFAPTMEWDTAAGQAICMAVGLKVIAKDTGRNLVYNKENLLNPHFLVSQ
jgi:3'(2'), 5'-bisphosphate nucleotidase